MKICCKEKVNGEKKYDATVFDACVNVSVLFR